jgi:hypothetical protein
MSISMRDPGEAASSAPRAAASSAPRAAGIKKIYVKKH